MTIQEMLVHGLVGDDASGCPRERMTPGRQQMLYEDAEWVECCRQSLASATPVQTRLPFVLLVVKQSSQMRRSCQFNPLPNQCNHENSSRPEGCATWSGDDISNPFLAHAAGDALRCCSPSSSSAPSPALSHIVTRLVCIWIVASWRLAGSRY